MESLSYCATQHVIDAKIARYKRIINLTFFFSFQFLFFGRVLFLFFKLVGQRKGYIRSLTKPEEKHIKGITVSHCHFWIKGVLSDWLRRISVGQFCCPFDRTECPQKLAGMWKTSESYYSLILMIPFAMEWTFEFGCRCVFGCGCVCACASNSSRPTCHCQCLYFLSKEGSQKWLTGMQGWKNDQCVWVHIHY